MRSVADRTLICLIARARNDAFMTDGAPYIFNGVPVVSLVKREVIEMAVHT